MLILSSDRVPSGESSDKALSATLAYQAGRIKIAERLSSPLAVNTKCRRYKAHCLLDSPGTEL